MRHVLALNIVLLLTQLASFSAAASEAGSVAQEEEMLARSVIHFNWGLHDLKHVTTAGTDEKSNDSGPVQATIGIYTRNLETITARLKATGARLIFSTTTPVVPGTLNPLREPDAPVRYNAAAIKIMEANHVRVSDLYAYCMPHLAEWQVPRNVHFKPKVLLNWRSRLLPLSPKK